MPGRQPDLKIKLRNAEGNLVPVGAAWEQNKGHFSGKLTIDANEYDMVIFKNELTRNNGNTKRPGNQPAPRPAG